MNYDALNRKTSVTDSLGRAINYTYDSNSNKVSMTDPTGVTTYIYNTLNRLTSLTDPAVKTYTFTYDTSGRRTGLTFPNGMPVSYTYDNVSRLLSIINGTVSTNSYVYDNIGNRTSMTNPSGTHNYGYDVIYRLLQATHPTPPTEQFTYDPAGNRLTDGSGNSYFYNTANRLLNYNGVTYQYDANGNTIAKVDSCGTTTYTWDSENRLTGISGFQPNCSALSASYKYDPFGRRIEKNVNGIVTKYLYDAEDILLEYDGSNQIASRYTHGPGIDEPLSMEKNSQEYYYHFDGLGSVTGITDSTGNVVQRYEYDSFGNIVSMLDPNFIQPYTYTAREYDPESGLYFYRARYYDAKVGRFISEDPIGFNGGSINVYSYTDNNPVNFIDPLGLASKGGGTEYFLGDCNADEMNQCQAKCAGKGVESCKVTYSYRSTVRNGDVRRAIYKVPGSMSCVCKDDDCPKNPPPTFPFFIPFPGGSGGGCFVSGTLVQTADGLKPIEEIQIGDMVLAWNENTSKNEFRRVVALVVAVRRDMVKIYVGPDDEPPLIASSNHKFYVKEKGWVKASELSAGDILLDKNNSPVKVRKAEQELQSDEIKVYNIEVEDLHNYYVGKTGILTHNRGLKDPAY
jgi:RHS repeat-associated protein